MNAQDNEFRTTLMFASDRAYQCISLLLDAGADVNVQDKRGSSASDEGSMQGKL